MLKSHIHCHKHHQLFDLKLKQTVLNEEQFRCGAALSDVLSYTEISIVVRWGR